MLKSLDPGAPEPEPNEEALEAENKADLVAALNDEIEVIRQEIRQALQRRRTLTQWRDVLLSDQSKDYDSIRNQVNNLHCLLLPSLVTIVLPVCCFVSGA